MSARPETPLLLDRPTCLLVSRHGAPQGFSGATVVSDFDDAFNQWVVHRHPVVFVDFSSLIMGLAGPRLCRRIRRLSGSCGIYFMVEQPPTLAHERWVWHCGATGVVRRETLALRQCMSAALKGATGAEATAIQRLGQDEMLLRRVTESLMRCVMEPAALWAVCEAWDHLLLANLGRVPSLPELVAEVGRTIDDPAAKDAFARDVLG